ncbi:hypothetical protein MMC11_000495 [Xylographa trunciseda]|nr:hypothetical protein [Xylographa trunciseda]
MSSPLQTATLQAAILNITSSIIAQLLNAYRKSSFGTSSSALNPLGLDFVAIFQYLTSTLLLTPPNFKWQEYLEEMFPGYPVQKGKQKMKVDEGGKGVVVEQKLDLRNTAIKFTLDQTVGAALNTSLFLVIIRLLRGGSPRDTTAAFSAFSVPSLITIYCLARTARNSADSAIAILRNSGRLCWPGTNYGRFGEASGSGKLGGSWVVDIFGLENGRITALTMPRSLSGPVDK